MSDLDDIDTGQETDDFGELEAVMASIAAEGEQSVSVKIYRLKNGKRTWLFNALPSDMNTLMETLRDDYRGGDFEAFVYKGNKIAKRKTFSVDTPIQKPESPAKMQTNNDSVLILVETMTRGFNELGKLIVESRPQIPVVDPQMQMRQTLETMSLMKQIFDRGTPQVDPTAQFLKGIEFAKEVAGDALGEKSDPTPGQVLANLADKLAPVLVNLTTPNQQANTQPIRRQQIQRPKQEMTPKPTTKQAPIISSNIINGGMINKKGNEQMNMMEAMLVKPLGALCNYAGQGMKSEELADSVIENVPDAFFNQFCDFIESPNAIDRMVSIEPKVANFRPWFSDLRERIIYKLTNDEDENSIDTDINGANTVLTSADYHTIDGDS